jgi:hypothetical protein
VPCTVRWHHPGRSERTSAADQPHLRARHPSPPAPDDATRHRIGAYLIQSQFQASSHSSALFLTASAQNLLCMQLATGLGVDLGSNHFLLWASGAAVPALLGARAGWGAGHQRRAAGGRAASRLIVPQHAALFNERAPCLARLPRTLARTHSGPSPLPIGPSPRANRVPPPPPPPGTVLAPNLVYLLQPPAITETPGASEAAAARLKQLGKLT